MKTPTVVFASTSLTITLLAGLTLFGALHTAPGPQRLIGLNRERTRTPALDTPQAQRTLAALAAQPIAFEPVAGRTADDTRYLVRGPGYTVFLDTDGPVVMVREPQPAARFGTLGTLARMLVSRWFHGAAPVHRLPLQFEQANLPIRWQALEPQPGYSNYFNGNEPAQWQSRVPHYGRLWAANLYPGIDLTFHGSGGELEYDFRLAPGADASKIRWRAGAADSITTTPSGAIRLGIGGTQIELRKPLAYQMVNGARHDVAVSYRVHAGTIGFALGAYDRSEPLVIDPVLVYSSLVGGGDSSTNALGLALDANGNAYVTGSTCAADFPSTPGAFGTRGGAFFAAVACEDVFVTKLMADGSGLAYSTFLRGSDRESAFRIAIDASGSAYIAGVTLSTDFPTTPGAFSRTQKGGNCTVARGFKTPCSDAFIAKLSPDGSALVYSTLLGGTRMDAAIGIAIDAAGAAYVTGWSNSPDLPVSASAFQKTYAGGTCFAGFAPCFDTFVAKLSADGSTLAYLTYLGGNDQEFAADIAVDAAGNAVVTGATSSATFPTTAGVVGPTHSAGVQDDIYVTKLNASGSALIYSTLVGGTGTDWPLAITLDASGAAYVAGSTTSADFPVTPGAYQPAYGGPANASCDLLIKLPFCGDAFVFKLNPGATGLVFSTYLGRAGNDGALGVAVDSAQRVWVTGQTGSATFASTPDAYYPAGNFGGFLVQLSADGKQLLYGSGLYGFGSAGTDLAVDAADNVYVLGTGNGIAPATPGAFSAGSGGAMVLKFSAGTAPAVQLSAPSFSFGAKALRSASAARTVLLTNPSATPLRLAVELVGRSTSAFLLTHDCPPTLGAGQACTLSVRFQPQVEGGADATVRITSNAPGSPHGLPASGLGVITEPGGFIPGALSFADQQAGTTSTRRNASLQVRPLSVTTGGANPADFNVNLSNCVVGGACVVDAAFAPLAGSIGRRSATVSVTADAFGSPLVLSLTGSVATSANLEVGPSAIDFYSRAIGATNTRGVTLKNSGAAGLSISTLALAPVDFSIVAGGCGALPITLAPQAQCSLTLQFAPAQIGTRSGVLTITHSAAGSPNTVSLSGVGTDPAGPQLSLESSGSTADYGPIQVGLTSGVPSFFRLSNFGAQPATIGLTLPPEFTLNTRFPTCGAVLAANSSCGLAFDFTPAAAGPRSGVVSVTTNAPGSPLAVRLTGIGVLIPSVAPAPQRLDFGRVGVNITSPLRTITVPNTGNGSVNMSGVSASGPFLVTNHCGATLAAGVSCTIDVRATPVALGPVSGLLSINDDSPGGVHGVMLNVEGVNGPALQADLGLIDFGKQPFGSTSAARRVTFSNTGNAAASLLGVAVNGDFVQTTTCGAALAVGATCSASVAFRPSLVSEPIGLVGLLTVGGNFGGSPVSVALGGLGTASVGAATQTVLSASANPVAAGQPVTFTAVVSSAAPGTLSGTVSFFDGALVLGSASLAAGQASFATSTLAAGAHSITAQYSGDAGFGASTSPALVEQVSGAGAAADFALRLAPTTLTVVAGQSASSALTVTPANGFRQAVSFECTGLPAGATCSFAPASVTPAGAPASTSLTITTSGNAVLALGPTDGRDGSNGSRHRNAPGPLGSVLFASLGVVAVRAASSAGGGRRRTGPGRRAAAALLLMGWVLALLAACGGSASDDAAAVGGTPAGSSTVTVTATSGSGASMLSHAVNLNLVVTR